MIDLFLARMASGVFPNVIRKGNSGGVYLTFDDGPDPNLTPRLLDSLDALDCRATFFMNGKQAETYPDVVRKAFERGHSIGSHGYTHESLLLVSRHKAMQDIDRSISVLKGITGEESSLYRPPYGRFNPSLARILRSKSITIVLWSVNPIDYRNAKEEDIVKRTLNRTHERSIVILHDYGRWATRTLDAVPKIVIGLRCKGFHPLPILPGSSITHSRN